MNFVSDSIPAPFKITSPFPVQKNSPLFKRSQPNLQPKLKLRSENQLNRSYELRKSSRQTNKSQPQKKGLYSTQRVPSIKKRGAVTSASSNHQITPLHNQSDPQIKQPLSGEVDFKSELQMLSEVEGTASGDLQKKIIYLDERKLTSQQDEDGTEDQMTIQKPGDLKAKLNSLIHTDLPLNIDIGTMGTGSKQITEAFGSHVDLKIPTEGLAEHLSPFQHPKKSEHVASDTDLPREQVPLLWQNLDTDGDVTSHATPMMQMQPLTQVQSVGVCAISSACASKPDSSSLQQEREQAPQPEAESPKLPEKKLKKKARSRTRGKSGKKLQSETPGQSLSSGLSKPMKITKLKLLKKEVEKSQPRQPPGMKPTEVSRKRQVTTALDSGQYEVIDKRDVHFLDPGNIKITTRMRIELNKSRQRRDETPSNITKINKMINEQVYRKQKQNEKVQEEEKFKVNSNARLINYVKQLQKEGKATLRKHIYSKRVGSQKNPKSPASQIEKNPASDDSSAQVNLGLTSPASRATFATSEARNGLLKDSWVVKDSNQFAASHFGSSNFYNSRKFGRNDDLVIQSVNQSNTNISFKDILSPSSPLEVQKLVQPLLKSSSSVASMGSSATNIKFFQNQKLQNQLNGTAELRQSQNLLSSHVTNQTRSAALSKQQEPCPLSCSTQGKTNYRGPLVSKFNFSTAPYRNRYQTSTSKPTFNAQHFVELQKNLNATSQTTSPKHQTMVPIQQRYTNAQQRGGKNLARSAHQSAVTSSAALKPPSTQVQEQTQASDEVLTQRTQLHTNLLNMQLHLPAVASKPMRPMTAKNSRSIHGDKALTHGQASSSFVGNQETTVDQSGHHNPLGGVASQSNAKRATIAEIGESFLGNSPDKQFGLLAFMPQDSSKEFVNVAQQSGFAPARQEAAAPRRRPVTSKPHNRQSVVARNQQYNQMFLINN